MKKRENKHYLEIMPAAMLSRRRAWQGIASGMLPGGCLIVVDTKNQFQTNLAKRVARTLRQKGKQVVIWSVEPFGNVH